MHLYKTSLFDILIFRENDLLKHQLKKYVNAVQMLRTEGLSKEGNSYHSQRCVLLFFMFLFVSYYDCHQIMCGGSGKATTSQDLR